MVRTRRVLAGALLNCACVAVFDGGPGGREFGRFVHKARVTQLGLVPSLAATWRQSGCMDGLDWSALRCATASSESSWMRRCFLEK